MANRRWQGVAGRRAAEDFASRMCDLVDIHYPHAERTRLSLDNVSTHSAAALTRPCRPQSALNMVGDATCRIKAGSNIIEQS